MMNPSLFVEIGEAGSHLLPLFLFILKLLASSVRKGGW
jgi:hypothetical protein